MRKIQLTKIKEITPGKTPVGYEIAGEITTNPSEGSILEITTGGKKVFRTSKIITVTDDTIVTETAVYNYLYLSAEGELVGDFPKINEFFDALEFKDNEDRLGPALGAQGIQVDNLSEKVASSVFKCRGDIPGALKILLPTLTPLEIALMIGGLLRDMEQGKLH